MTIQRLYFDCIFELDAGDDIGDHLARVYCEKKRDFVGQHFWACGYFVSTVGRDEATIREDILARRKTNKLPRRKQRVLEQR